jgi:hypothetical protein
MLQARCQIQSVFHSDQSGTPLLSWRPAPKLSWTDGVLMLSTVVNSSALYCPGAVTASPVREGYIRLWASPKLVGSPIFTSAGSQL